MNIHKKKLLKSLQWGVPDDKDAQKLVKRLQEYKAAYFRFIRAAIPPTNNPAEQTIRKVVLDRKVTQGTRSDWGNRWLGRFWSIQTTCEQKGRNLLDYMTKRSSTISEVSFPYRSFIPDYHKLDILSVNDYLNLYWIPSHLVTFRNENILKTKGKSTLREIKIIF